MIEPVVDLLLPKTAMLVAGAPVKVLLTSVQTVFVPVMEALGLACTVTVRVALSVQPFAFVTVTV